MSDTRSSSGTPALRQVLAVPTDSELKHFGYAPGNYMSRCLSCDQVKEEMDKRAISCRACAESRYKTIVEAIAVTGVAQAQTGSDTAPYYVAWLEAIEHCNKLKEENYQLRNAQAGRDEGYTTDPAIRSRDDFLASKGLFSEYVASLKEWEAKERASPVPSTHCACQPQQRPECSYFQGGYCTMTSTQEKSP